MSNQSLTNAGRAFMAAKQAAGQPAIIDRFMLANIAGLDHTQPVNQNETIPAVGDQIKTVAVTKDGYISPDEVVYSLYLPTTDGDYTYNWLGLLADDDTLVAVAYLAPVNKYATAGGSIGNALNENIMVAYTDAQEITNITVDASAWQFDFEQATETQLGLMKIASQQKTDDGADDETALTALKLRNTKIQPHQIMRYWPAGAANGNGPLTYIGHPDGAELSSNSATVIGYLKISLPNHGENLMLGMFLDVYLYGTNESITLYLAGYTYSTMLWKYTTVTQQGGLTPLTVRFGNDGNTPCIWIGEAITDWTYPRAWIRDLFTGHSDGSILASGWEMAVDDTAPLTVGRTNINRVFDHILPPTPDEVGAVPTSGGTMTGNLEFEHDKGVTCQDTGGTAHTLLEIDSANKTRVGNLNLPTRIYSSVNPVINTGAGDNLIFHEGHTPTPAEVGAVAAGGVTNLSSSTTLVVSDDFILQDLSLGTVNVFWYDRIASKLKLGGGDTEVLLRGNLDTENGHTLSEQGQRVYSPNNHPVPAGTISAIAGSAIPAGTIECNGAELSRTTYADLFAAIGTTYGVGDGSTTFNVPDLRGEFLRGFDGGRGIDSGRALGSWQDDELKSHTHQYGWQDGQSYDGTGYPAEGSGIAVNWADTTATGGGETRPRNISVKYCIKY